MGHPGQIPASHSPIKKKKIKSYHRVWNLPRSNAFPSKQRHELYHWWAERLLSSHVVFVSAGRAHMDGCPYRFTLPSKQHSYPKAGVSVGLPYLVGLKVTRGLGSLLGILAWWAAEYHLGGCPFMHSLPGGWQSHVCGRPCLVGNTVIRGRVDKR